MKRFLLIVVALLAVTLSATHSSAFPLGVYSFLGNKDKVYTQKDSLISWMHSLSYNTNIMEIFPEGMQPDGPVHSELDFSGVLSQMNSNFIDAIVMDRSWKNSDYEHSSYYLTNSNYVMIQAEIFDENAVADYSTNNDNYWYCSNGVINNGSEPIPFAPNPGLDRVGVFDAIGRIAWLCSPTDHVAGYAYGDLKSRWGANPLVYKLFSAQPPPPMHTFPYEQPIFADNDAFYITYHIKIVSPPASPANTPLLYFRVAFYDQNGNVIAIPSVVTGPANTVITDGLLTNTVYSTVLDIQ